MKTIYYCFFVLFIFCGIEAKSQSHISISKAIDTPNEVKVLKNIQYRLDTINRYTDTNNNNIDLLMDSMEIKLARYLQKPESIKDSLKFLRSVITDNSLRIMDDSLRIINIYNPGSGTMQSYNTVIQYIQRNGAIGVQILDDELQEYEPTPKWKKDNPLIDTGNDFDFLRIYKLKSSRQLYLLQTLLIEWTLCYFNGFQVVEIRDNKLVFDTLFLTFETTQNVPEFEFNKLTQTLYCNYFPDDGCNGTGDHGKQVKEIYQFDGKGFVKIKKRRKTTNH